MGAPITVLGNVAIDRVDGGPPRAGGCPTFAAPLLAATGGSVLTRCAPADRPVFDPVVRLCRATVVEAATTTSFVITNDGDERDMEVTDTGEAWGPADLDGVELEGWVHVAPLLQGDAGPDVLVAIAGRGCRIAYDGQGLVRVRAVGPVRSEPAADPGLLRLVDVLKLSSEEARCVAGEAFLEGVRALGVPEVVVTLGAAGAIVIAGGEACEIAPPRVVAGVDPTGSGDTFMTSYVGSRAAGADPERAASLATVAVVRLLESRHRS